MLWELDQEKTTHLPQFVDKALKLLNLKQVAFEIENSVMSKVSCTACQAGKVQKLLFENFYFLVLLIYRCWFAATLYQNWEVREGN